jgi:hypothetical protein
VFLPVGVDGVCSGLASWCVWLCSICVAWWWRGGGGGGGGGGRVTVEVWYYL